MSGASFCRWCFGALSLAKAGGLIYEEVKDPLGNVLRVHKTCKASAEADFKHIPRAPIKGKQGGVPPESES